MSTNGHTDMWAYRNMICSFTPSAFVSLWSAYKNYIPKMYMIQVLFEDKTKVYFQEVIEECKKQLTAEERKEFVDLTEKVLNDLGPENLITAFGMLKDPEQFNISPIELLKK